MSLLFFFFNSPLKGNTRTGVLIVLVRLLAEAYRLVFVHSRAKGILLCVCGIRLHVREVPQQLRMDLFLSALKGNAELSESDFPR